MWLLSLELGGWSLMNTWSLMVYFSHLILVSWNPSFFCFFLDQKPNRSFLLIKKIKKDETSFHNVQI